MYCDLTHGYNTAFMVHVLREAYTCILHVYLHGVWTVQGPSALQNPLIQRSVDLPPWCGETVKVSCEPLGLRSSGPPPHLGPRWGLNRIAGGPGSHGACLVCPESGDKNVDDHSNEDQGGSSIVELI